MTVRLTAGQAGDNPQLIPLLDEHVAARTERGMSGRNFGLLADKAYSHPSTRIELRARRIKHTIPERSDQIARRKAKGPDGGRPPAFDPARYALRNAVERGCNRLKQWRGIATRYDKYALTYLGGVLLACAVIHTRVGTLQLGDTPQAIGQEPLAPLNHGLWPHALLACHHLVGFACRATQHDPRPPRPPLQRLTLVVGQRHGVPQTVRSNRQRWPHRRPSGAKRYRAQRRFTRTSLNARYCRPWMWRQQECIRGHSTAAHVNWY